MDDFSEHEDQQFFDHINDQSDDEGVGGPTSPPLKYHQPRCSMELNLDHLRHHFVQQQDSVQPPTGALEVGMNFDEKAQCIRVLVGNQKIQYNIRNHCECKKIYSDQRRLNFVCKSHENGCT